MWPGDPGPWSWAASNGAWAGACLTCCVPRSLFITLRTAPGFIYWFWLEFMIEIRLNRHGTPNISITDRGSRRKSATITCTKHTVDFRVPTVWLVLRYVHLSTCHNIKCPQQYSPLSLSRFLWTVTVWTPIWINSDKIKMSSLMSFLCAYRN